MKPYYFFALLVLASCSSENGKATAENSIEEKQTYFEQIFTSSMPIFNGYELGESAQSAADKISLENQDFYSYEIEVVESKVNAIQLIVFSEDTVKLKKLQTDIIDKYNQFTKRDKALSKFITWTYSSIENLPVQITLIYEKELNTVSLDIEYKSQR